MGRDIIRTWDKCPPAGWVTQAIPLRAIDGDTLVLAIVKLVRARLVNCWCPESRTRDEAEKAIGIQGKESLSGILDAILWPMILKLVERLPLDLRRQVLAVVKPAEFIEAFKQALDPADMPRAHLLGADTLSVSDDITMERFLCDVWTRDTINLSDVQVDRGLAVPTREELAAWRASGWKRRPRRKRN